MAFVGGGMLLAGCGGPANEQGSGAPTAGAGASQPVASSETSAAQPVPLDAAGSAASTPSASSSTLSPAAASSAAASPAVPEYREVSLPAGTSLSLRLTSAVASDTSQVEDAVRATLREAVVVDGATVFPEGAEVEGTVTGVERSGRVRGLARVAFRFNTVRSEGVVHTIRTDTVERVAEPTKTDDAKKIGIGAGVGAAVGAVLGGGDGAAKGAAIGAGAGTGAVLATRGDEVRLGAGAAVRARLAAPATVQLRVRN